MYSKNYYLKYYMLTFLLAAYSVTATAKPNLADHYDIEGVRVYRDDTSKNIWYMSPPELSLKTKGEVPQYMLDLFRYSGRSGTGDRDKFWAKGVLTLGIEMKHSADTIKKIKQSIKKEYSIKGLKLKRMPVAGSRYRVVFGDKEHDWSEYARWTSKDISIPLDQHISQILWSASENEQTLISIELEQLITGGKKLEDSYLINHTSTGDDSSQSNELVEDIKDAINSENNDKDQQSTNDKETSSNEESDTDEQKQYTTINSSIPVSLDIKKYPNNFSKVDLDASMSRGYTEVNLFCFDFIENTIPDLYAVFVDIAIHTEGRDLIETVRFDERGSYREKVSFKLSKKLDEPYGYKITYVFKDGSKKITKWKSKHNETMLDITSYTNLSTKDLDSQGQR